MSDLQNSLNEILRQKNTYLLPENIKKDVTVLNVTGIYEGGGGSGDVKLFETVEGMQADSEANVGDLAVVYREEIQPVTEESKFSSCIFPYTVVLSSKFTGNIYGSFSEVDSSSGYFNGNVQMSRTMFRFNGRTGSGSISVQYTSNNGITYTRTVGDELQEFGTTIKWNSDYGEFNSIFGNFMKISANYFEGLYENKPYEDENELHWCDMQESIITDSAITPKFTEEFIEPTYINDFIDKTRVLSRYDGDDYLPYLFITMNADKTKLHGYSRVIDRGTYDEYQPVDFDISYYRGKMYQKCMNSKGDTDYLTNQKVLEYDISTGNITSSTYTEDLDIGTTTVYAYTEITDRYILGRYNYKKDTNNIKFTFNHLKDDATTYNDFKYSIQINIPLSEKNKYFLASTQLNTIPDYVYNGYKFYSKNGVQQGTLGAVISTTFNDTNARIYANAQNIYNNMTPLVSSDNDKRAGLGTDIVIIPCKSDGTPLLDTSSVTDMTNMFDGCRSLTTIPSLDTSSATDMSYMFMYCQNLTTIPLLDTSSVTDIHGMFYYCSNLTTIPLLDTSNVTNMDSMFQFCKSLTSIPLLDTSRVTNMRIMLASCTSLTTIPLLDTSNVTDMYYMFNNCTNLTSIPLLNTSNVTNMGIMFKGCPSLTDNSLNNILAMCTNATKISSNKTLKYIGLTQEQATTCTTLSNYQAFVNVGWTTGY